MGDREGEDYREDGGKTCGGRGRGDKGDIGGWDTRRLVTKTKQIEGITKLGKNTNTSLTPDYGFGNFGKRSNTKTSIFKH